MTSATIETYSPKHRDGVIRLIEAFYDESLSEYQATISREAIIETIDNGDPQNCFILVSRGECAGLLYGLRFKSPTGDDMIFQEVMWYVDKTHRGLGVWLLQAIEKHLKDAGIHSIIMAVLENSKTEKLKRLYTSMGYKPVETHYMRVLNGQS